MNKVKKEIRKIYFLNGNTTEITHQKPKKVITEEYDPHGNITLHRIEEVIDGKFVVSPESQTYENQYDVGNKLSNVKVFQNHKMIRQESFFYHHFSQKYISIISEDNRIEKEVYCGSGKIIRKEYYTLGETNEAKIIEYEYDESHDKLIAVKYSNNGILIGNENFEYDDDNNLVSWNKYYNSAEDITKEFAYYEQGQKIMHKIERLDKENHTLYKRSFHYFKKEENVMECVEYNDGEVTKYERTKKKKGNKEIKKRTVYMCVSDNDDTNEFFYFLENVDYENGVVIRQCTQKFDAENRLVERKITEQNGDYYLVTYHRGNPSERKRAAYNSDGQMISTEMIEKYLETYDDTGNLIKKTRTKTDGITTSIEEKHIEYYPSES
ncbi:hypothetical protein ACI75Y_03915 [Capnocytophaga stomatis]|uniref:hypothetical protein n=1 Tax=Capnocytophaga stomatis TaxID=1848904 RepID=UPI0038580150